MGKKTKSGFKIGAWHAIAVVLLLVVLLPFTLYLPWVQSIVKDYACQWASRATSLEITIDRVLLKFPLNISVDGLLVLDQQRDTMVQATNFTAGVAVMPLLKMDVEIDDAILTQCRYLLVADDSSMVLKARAQRCAMKGLALDLDCNQLNVVEAALKGGDVALDYYPHKVVTECDTTPTKPWTIRAYHLTLHDVNYAMTMLPTIDKLTAHVHRAELTDGIVDTRRRQVQTRSLVIDSTAVSYVYPTPQWATQWAAAHPVPSDSLCAPTDTIPWTIKADSLRLNNSRVAHAMVGAPLVAGAGLNTSHIDVRELNIAIDNFYNRGANIALNLTKLACAETGSALAIEDGRARLTLNSSHIGIEDTHLKTLLSDVNLDAHIDLSFLDNPSKGYIHIATNSHIALQDVSRLVPQLKPMLGAIPQVAPLSVRGEVSGNATRVDIANFTAQLPRYARATVTGTLNNPTQIDKMAGNLQVAAQFDNINFVKPTLLNKAMQQQVNFPPMSLTGTAKINCGEIAANAVMTLVTGTLVGQGTFNTHNNAYDLNATFNNFPARAVAPLWDIDNLTATVQLKGTGFDFLSPSTNVTAQLDVPSITYRNAAYRNLSASVMMNGGTFVGTINSANENCYIGVDLNGTINGRRYVVDAVGDARDLDLEALGLYKGKCQGAGKLVAHCDVDLDGKVYDATVSVHDMMWHLDDDVLVADVASVTLASDAAHTHLTFDNEDNHVEFASTNCLDTLVERINRSSEVAIDQFGRRSINIDTLQAAMPQFDLSIEMGTDGLAQRYVQKYGVDFRKVKLDMRNDSTIFVDGFAHSISLDGTNIDTLTLKATQWNKYLAFNAHMGNRPGTMDEWAQVNMRGGVRGATLDFLVTQQNIRREMGYRLGCNATLTDTAVNMKLFPREPIIGYRKWDINEDNHVNFNYGTRMLDADLRLESDSSIVALATHRTPGTTTEDIWLDIANLRIEEWTKFLPDLDPMSGVLNAHMDVDYDGHAIEGKGELNLTDFVYNGMREGNFTINTTYGIDPATRGTRLNADVLVDGSHVAMAHGSMGEAGLESPLNLSMKLNRFPLVKLSPFIPGQMLLLRGYASGEVSLSGSGNSPLVNGHIEADSAFITLPRYGSSLKLCEDKLSISDNVVNFIDYRIAGLNNNPIVVNGVINARNLNAMVIDLKLAGKNVQFIGSDQRNYSEIFGKAFANVNASVWSRSDYMSVRADLALLAGSNITYVMQDELSTLTSQVDKNMVTYVNLKDAQGGSPMLITAKGTSATNILANIEVEQGAKINAYLSPDGKDRATIDGSGHLKYTLDFAGKDALSGTYNIESGNVRYTPPLITSKNFDITSGSSIVWNGDMFNPQLNLKATSRVKTSVSSSDQGARPVDFLVTANLGGTLSVIKLDFDLGAVNDLTVSNELQAMSDVQRSQAAINLLLYNTYSGTNSAGNVNNLTASSALFSFVQSQLNSWASKAFKGVDLSFGINQFEAKSGHGIETSYSYRLSKNLFNDRFKIVVGGEYSTDASAEENFAQNLISDISFEYSLGASGNKYLRLFRHTGTESILEGQVTETGVGFVMKHKVESLGSLFGRKPLKITIKDTIAPSHDDGTPPNDTTITPSTQPSPQ